MPSVSEGGGLFTGTGAYLDTFTVDHTINNNPDNIVGAYFLDAVPRLAIGDRSVVQCSANVFGQQCLYDLVARHAPADLLQLCRWGSWQLRDDSHTATPRRYARESSLFHKKLAARIIGVAV